MTTYSKQKKAEILKLLEPPESLSIAKVSKKEKISQKTIKVWVDKEKEENSMENSKKNGIAKKNFTLLWKLTP